MTFKDLKKRLSLETTFHQQSKLSEILMNKPFWIWNIEEHKHEDIRTKGDCCFNHIIGLPDKDGIDKPLYDYQKIIFDYLVTQNSVINSNKHLWIKKATGLGISEFILRFMAWLCLKDSSLAGSQMCIVTGPRIDLAIALIDRMKKLFAEYKRDCNRTKQCKDRSISIACMSEKPVVNVYFLLSAALKTSYLAHTFVATFASPVLFPFAAAKPHCNHHMSR
ncbi:MAG: hypothetical protein ACJ72V_16850, partial [Nitrososphaeraceae archaeon]